MRTTILFGGMSRERLVSVASAKALATALPGADLWFWAPDDKVYVASDAVLQAHQRPFELDLPTEGASIGGIEAALDKAKAEDRVLVLGMHGGEAENGDLAALCEARRVAFTGSDSKSSRLAFDKIATKVAVAQAGVDAPSTVELADAEAALAKYGKLVAKPVADGSSYGLIFVNGPADLETLEEAAGSAAYVIEPFVAGLEATCGVLEQADGSLIALPPVEIHPADGAFDYAAKYLAAATREICPATFPSEIIAAIQTCALKAHETVGAGGYSRSDFIVTPNGPIFLEINTLPGMTAASLYPKSLKAQGIAFTDFLAGQITLATARAKTEAV
ncbi:D-alanine--D-alanine ligase family protein [Caulobacter sp. DWP3-1-3b2]|uniref:D-alanine--D-alanine ligase family protein n=1 Tax=unclassified Caulobacter TaxID=2648921 RepID=UPI0019C86E78|nr:ATP-grasp domain-containing protein [Caulobacter sp.]